MIVVYLGTHPYACTQDVNLFEAYASRVTLVHIDPDPSLRNGGTSSQALVLDDIVGAIESNGSAAVIVASMPAAVPGNRFRAISELNRWLGVRSILRRLRASFDEDLVLVCQRPDLLPSLRGLPAALRVYEVRDDYAALEDSPSKARSVARASRRMMREADLVWTTSQRLAEDAAKLTNEVFESSNGVDYRLFADAVGAPLPALMADIGRPRVGLVGMLNDRIDWDLIEALAIARPQWQLTFIGPVYRAGPATTLALQRLAAFENVHLLPGVDHSDVPLHIASLDVGLIPYRLTEATLRINPYKVYQYLAAGRPVVSSRLPALTALDDVVTTCSKTDEFVAAIEAALTTASNAEAVAQRQQHARMFDWSRVADRRINAARVALAARAPCSSRATAAG